VCGRYSQTHSLQHLEAAFNARLNAGIRQRVTTRYNIAPSQEVAVVRTTDKGRELVALRWGLIPSWMKDIPKSAPLINARAETVASKPAFRTAYKRRRCLVPADGFYEWKQDGASKQPYYIHLPDNAVFGFAGLWEHWEKDHQHIESCTLLTTDANPAIQSIHARMPIIIAPQDYALWLGEQQGDVNALLQAHANDKLISYPISRHVNSPKNDDAQCVEPLK